MIRKVIAIVMTLMLMTPTVAYATTSLSSFIKIKDKSIIEEKITECQKIMTHAHEMAESARSLGYSEDHQVIKLAKEEWIKAYKNYTEFQNRLNQIKEKEYPVAKEVWDYLKSLGYNDYVCAGILGNMMAEVGGGTLDLDWDAGTNFYGLCQWSIYYFPEVQGLNVQKQLEFLKDSIKPQFDAYSYLYKKDFSYEQFLLLEDERKAALAFAIIYERCAKQYNSRRADYAEIAYEYFTN